ncbi:MAG: hypothetical protein K5981_00510 [Clostridia bacterium]|nr:hypothetical protein [Clostridia bacterium]
MKMCCKSKKTKKSKGFKVNRILLGNLLKIILIWCVAQSVQKTIEANAAAKARAESRSHEQEWEFDRIYPGQ